MYKRFLINAVIMGIVFLLNVSCLYAFDLGENNNVEIKEFTRAELASMKAKSAIPKGSCAKSELLVKFKDSAARSKRGDLHKRIGSKVINRYNIVKNLELIKLPDTMSVKNGIAEYLKNNYVDYVEPNYVRFTSDTTPDDTMFTSQWGLSNTGQTGGESDADIDAVEAWDIETGDDDIVVAVIDTGIDFDHEDLAENMWTNPGEIEGNGIDDDGNGYVDDYYGWDFFRKDNLPYDTSRCAHGTHIAGMIGAKGNNGLGVAGVSWNVKIMSLRALGGLFCLGFDSDTISAIEYASEQGAHIANMSFGGITYNKALEDAMRDSNIIFVASAGNGGLDRKGDDNDGWFPQYPASFSLENIVSVAATDEWDNLVSFSNYGVQSVDLGAPGNNIYSTTPWGSYGSLSGTSMAASFVSGALALILSKTPDLENWQYIYMLLKGVDDKGLPVATGGRLNVYNSLSLSPLTKTRYEQDALTYDGSWQDYVLSDASEGTLKYSNQVGASASLSFNGTGVFVVASTAHLLGIADIYIDGSYETSIDQYSSSAAHNNAVYSNTSLDDGDHTIEIMVKGQKNWRAATTIITIDAIDVLN